MGAGASRSRAPPPPEETPEETLVELDGVRLRPEERSFHKRVQQLMACRRRGEELARELQLEKLSLESFGEPQMQSVLVKPDSQLAAILAGATKAKRALDALGRRLVERATAQDPTADALTYVYEAVSLKPAERARQKAIRDYGGAAVRLTDVARGSIVCADTAAVESMLRLVMTCDVRRFKNRFLEPHFNGYRDALFTLAVPGALVELQVHHKRVKLASERHGYDGQVFYRSRASETLDLHCYFRDYFVGLDVLESVGDERAMTSILASGDRATLESLESLLEKTGDVDFRSRVLMRLDELRDDTACARTPPKLKLASLFGTNGLTDAQAHVIRQSNAAPSGNIVRTAINHADHRLFGLLVAHILSRAEEPAEQPLRRKTI